MRRMAMQGRQVCRATGLGIALVLIVAAVPAAARGPLKPAELPPPQYRGQQYVDSRGCLFLRAGTAKVTEWIPRVTQEGVPLCGYPPSGQRVPVVDSTSKSPPVASVEPTDAPPAAPEETGLPPVAGGHLVAIGTFNVAKNADRATARLKALNYPVARSRLGGDGGPVTIYAGPFATAEQAGNAARELRGAGFADAFLISR